MEFLETQKVDRFIEKLSRFEKQVFTTLKENQDKRLFDIIQVADDQLRLFSFAQLIVHETLDISHQYWKDIFLNYSTDNVKRLASSNEESRQSSLTYGEIDFFSFANILDRAEPKHGDVFVDLGRPYSIEFIRIIGHGIGKGLICAGLLYGHTFKQAFGVEIVSDLYSLSLRMIENYRANIHENPFFSEHECELLVEQGDLLSDSISEYWINAGKV